MSSSTEKIRYSKTRQRDQVIAMLDQLRDAFAAGRVEIRTEGEELCLAPADFLDVTMKADRKGTRQRLRLELSWKHIDAPELRIASVRDATRERLTVDELGELLNRLTVERLYEMAQRLDVPGRSGLGKDGLARELTERSDDTLGLLTRDDLVRAAGTLDIADGRALDTSTLEQRLSQALSDER